MADWVIDKNDIESTVDGNYVLYRNRPIVREDNVIVYGDVLGKYYVQMIIMSEKEYKGHKVPGQVYMTLIDNDPSLPKDKCVVKDSMRNGLDEAFDFAVAWLDRYEV